MENLSKMKVSKIVAQNFKTAKVFTTYGIDFCCNGGIPLEEACEIQNVDIDTIIGELRMALTTAETEDFSAMPMDTLTEYIEKTNHTYVRNTIPALTTYLQKIASVHGERHPELLEIRDSFQQSAIELANHMQKEEQVLFPYIKAMANATKSGYPLSAPHFGNVKNPIAMMEHEHQQEGDRFKKIAKLTDQYTAPKDACQTYSVSFSMLQEFEQDLHKHIHLENNILFPSAVKAFEELELN